MSGGHRLEGRAKVTGALPFVDDLRADAVGSGFLVAVPVTSRVATGTVEGIGTTAALAVPGVRLVLTHETAPRLRKVLSVSMAEVGERLPLQDARILYHGQIVALVVAETLAAAQEGARLVDVRVRPGPGPVVALKDAGARLAPVGRAGIAPGKIAWGDALRDLNGAPHRYDATFRCAPHHHNAIEPSAVIARWDPDGGVTIRAAVQWQHIDTMLVGQAFGLDRASRLPGMLAEVLLGRRKPGQVRLINTMAGGAFGRNLSTIHLLLACMAAKVAGEAVKVVLTREQTFTLLSYRGEVRQRLRIGAEADGRLRAIVQEPDVAKGAKGRYVEPVGEVPLQIYAHRSHLLRHRVAALDLNGTGWMRAPGMSSAIFALETAMDELARELALDPIELKRRNHAETNPQTGKPWGSKSLLACYEEGARAIGWAGRAPGGSRRPDGRVVGFGMATSFDLGRQFPATAEVELRGDGTATVSVALAEMGQGTLTALATLSAEALGLPRDRVRLRTQEAHLPYGAGSIGSTGLFSNAAAVREAVEALLAALARKAVRDRTSALHGCDPATLRFRDGRLVAPDGAGEELGASVARHGGSIRRTARTGRTFGAGKLAKASFGAVFTEVAVDPVTLEVSVERLVGAFACGRIVEPVIARNQVAGGMIWGLGQALFEESRLDRRTGRWTNANLAEALIATQADVPDPEVIFVSEDDTAAHPLGIKGLAEIGVVGPAPAIANAFYDATGRRLRSLPILLEERLAAPVDPNWRPPA